ncbi:JAB domain-containing protein [Desulforhopalus sp. IMCC35007]|uniref:JAB domain-containing protein n=1 Tax=Desulforhopalus sp. IMCC35007 TaxID=2569543 RepID=UPI0010ADFFD6|nr:JAB domain-containing protein [Desulforhopalus sp. IMCC35007]TKB08835.1 DNA repair protein [Desulforhopalus sp. IMCC35007]
MLFIKDQDGEYHPAPKKLILTEANKLMGYRLRRGALILSSECAKAVIGGKLRGKQCEVFACLFLDARHRVLAFKEMFTGSINHATVHPREIVKEALQLNAVAIILAHNHPSGGSEPSSQDISLTATLINILKVVDVRILDHLVVGDEVTAFSDLGLLPEN